MKNSLLVILIVYLIAGSYVDAAENKKSLPSKLSLRPYYHPVTDTTIIAELLTITDKEKRVEYAQEKVRQEMVALAKDGLPVPNHKQVFNDICSKWGILSQLVKPMPPTP